MARDLKLCEDLIGQRASEIKNIISNEHVTLNARVGLRERVTSELDIAEFNLVTLGNVPDDALYDGNKKAQDPEIGDFSKNVITVAVFQR